MGDQCEISLIIIKRRPDPSKRMDAPELSIATLEELLDTPAISLADLLPDSTLDHVVAKLKNDISLFTRYLLHNQSTFQEVVDLAMKTHVFHTPYAKKLSNFCIDVLSGDLVSVAELFVREDPSAENDADFKTLMEEPVE